MHAEPTWKLPLARRGSVTLASAVLALCAAVQPAWAGAYEDLGKLERETVDAALKELDRKVLADPAGKTVRHIIVRNREVFSADDSFFTWFNVFHTTTKEDVIAREVLLRPGQRWDQALVDETLRNLRDPFLTSVLVVLPLQTDDPAQVDLLVVTRDVWSLRISSDFQLSGDVVTTLLLALTENNLLGRRKKLSLRFDMDQGAWALGPRYVDPNIAGTRLKLDTSFDAIFARDGGGYEGTRSRTELVYPLWSLAQRWGGGVVAEHFDGVQRFYQGDGLRTYDAPETAATEAVPYRYERLRVAVTSVVAHSIGRAVKHQLNVGHEYLETRNQGLAKDVAALEPAVRAAWERDVLPRSEVSSAVFFEYNLFTPRYATYRDLATYDLREDYRVGPALDLRVAGALTALGSDENFARLSTKLQWAFDHGGTYLQLRAEWAGRLQDGEVFDNGVGLRLWLATPLIGDVFRVVAKAELAFRVDERSNGFYSTGGDTGLRGYAIGAFAGLARYQQHLELRSRPLRLWSLRIGGVLFWDAGHAAGSCSAGKCTQPGDALGALSLKHDVGLGLRWLIAQLNPSVFRVDWAFALNGSTAGWPGRVSLGFEQAF